MSLTAAETLARYAVGLKAREIPPEVISRVKDITLDTLAITIYGSTKPWSRTVLEVIRRLAVKGPCTVLGRPWRVPAPQAALANGTMAHAFELDNVRHPGGGVHPGATGLLPALALAEQVKASGRDLITAFVAASEVMCRIGVAAGNALERRGFHAPALTGTFGAAVAAGRLLRLNAKQMSNALGIAGSYSGGLLEFTNSHETAMIKRLHLGKAAEGGVMATLLAQRGFAGPATVLEGKFGFCRAFSDSPDLDYLTKNLGKDFETLNTCIKRFACHINAHAPIEALQNIRDKYRLTPQEIQKITVSGMEKLVTHHAIYQPGDLMSAQYSVPFCVALSLFHDPRDPGSFSERRVRDPRILEFTRKVHLAVDEEIERNRWERAARVSVELSDGRNENTLVVHFRGTPANPLDHSELCDKAQRMNRGLITKRHLERLVAQVSTLEKVNDISSLTARLRVKF